MRRRRSTPRAALVAAGVLAAVVLESSRAAAPSRGPRPSSVRRVAPTAATVALAPLAPPAEPAPPNAEVPLVSVTDLPSAPRIAFASGPASALGPALALAPAPAPASAPAPAPAPAPASARASAPAPGPASAPAPTIDDGLGPLPPPAAVRKPAPAVPGPPQVRTGTAGCSPPFYYDEVGLKILQARVRELADAHRPVRVPLRGGARGGDVVVCHVQRPTAASPTRWECIAADTDGQSLRMDGKLLRARKRLAVCASAGCRWASCETTASSESPRSTPRSPRFSSRRRTATGVRSSRCASPSTAPWSRIASTAGPSASTPARTSSRSRPSGGCTPG